MGFAIVVSGLIVVGYFVFKTIEVIWYGGGYDGWLFFKELGFLT